MLSVPSRELLAFVDGSPPALLQVVLATAGRRTFARIVNCPTYPVPARTPDLSLAATYLRSSLGTPGGSPATVLARLYAAARSLAQRKRVGQFFTPASVADWALSITPPNGTDSIWDPGCGTAVFAEALVRRGLAVRCYIGIENDPVLALCAAYVLEAVGAPETFKIWYTNFLALRRGAFEPEHVTAPSLIVSNPPFVRFHNLRGRDRMLASVKAGLGITLSPLAGAGNYFLCRGVELLEDAERRGGLGGTAPRLLFFFPKEAAGAAHMRRLREDLRWKRGWQWREYSIPSDHAGADRSASNALALCFVFERSGEHATPPARQKELRHVVGDLLEVRRGISTGCNDFFVLTDSQARERAIPRHRLRAVLPTRIALKGPYFSEADWDALRNSGHPCWLLALPTVEPGELELSVRTYLKEGLRRGLHSTPTARRLRTWYSLPVPRTPPDVFITYFFRGAPRFVLNSARVLHLTNILGGRFLRAIGRSDVLETVIESLNSAASRWIEEEKAGREYRDGLMKIEPRELQRLPISASVLERLGQPARSGGLAELTLFD